jgi:hypothetical protein
VSAVVTHAQAFRSRGVNISGDNWLNKYDPVRRKFVWHANLTTVSRNVYGGFNDATHDRHGNTWVCGTWPGTILKIGKTGKKIEEWYVPEVVNRTVMGFTGIESIGDDTLLVVDGSKGAVFRFDMHASSRKKRRPMLVPVDPPVEIVRSDAMRLPDRYHKKVLLITDQSRGVVVLRSQNKWRTAEYLGLVPNDPTLPPGGLTASVVQMRDRIYMVPNWFFEPKVEGTLAGNRSVFYLPDITEQVDLLVGK